MWNRAELKARARSVLSGHYWKSFFVSLILVFISGGSSSQSFSSITETFSNSDMDCFFGGIAGGNTDYIFSIATPIIIAISVITILITLAFSIFISYPLEVGASRYFLETTQKRYNFSNIVYAFSNGYGSVVRTLLLRGIYLFLWYLLFMIPGFIKSFSYMMVPYILAENPKIGADKAITLSRKMMDGHKFNAFVLGLSFIGWYILGAIALGIGIIFVNPYVYTTQAQLYVTLRALALEKGIVTLQELEGSN